MILANSFKIATNNAGLVWKVLLYQVLCIVILCGIAVAACYTLVMNLVHAGFFDSLLGLISDSILNVRVGEILGGLSSIMNEFYALITANISQLLPLVIALIVIFGVLGSFLLNLIQLPLLEYVYGYMGSCSKLSFLGVFVKNFGRSVKFSLCNLLVTLPIDLLIVGGFVGSLLMFKGSTLLIAVAPFLIMLGLTVLLSLRISIFSAWGVNVVARDEPIWKSLKNGIKVVCRSYPRVLGSSVSLMLIFIVLNLVAFILTAAVGLFVTVPLTTVICAIFSTTVFFENSGLRYYVDRDKIITPKKLEERDSMKSLKSVI